MYPSPRIPPYIPPRTRSQRRGRTCTKIFWGKNCKTEGLSLFRKKFVMNSEGVVFKNFFGEIFLVIFIDMGLKHFIWFLLFLSCSPTEDVPYTEPAHIYTSYEQSCISSLNVVRESYGVQPLILHNGLSELAMEHAIYLSKNKVINHNNYGIRLYVAQDMGFIGLSENIAYGYTSVDSLIAAWLKSDGHRDNLLDIVHTHHGFGISSDIYGNMYYVHLFSH